MNEKITEWKNKNGDSIFLLIKDGFILGYSDIYPCERIVLPNDIEYTSIPMDTWLSKASDEEKTKLFNYWQEQIQYIIDKQKEAESMFLKENK